MDFQSGAALGGLDVISINILKYADKNNNEGLRWLGSLIGGWQYRMFSQGLDSTITRNIVWDVVSDVLVTISGIFLWGEQLTNRQYIGIALSLIGIYLLK